MYGSYKPELIIVNFFESMPFFSGFFQIVLFQIYENFADGRICQHHAIEVPRLKQQLLGLDVSHRMESECLRFSKT